MPEDDTILDLTVSQSTWKSVFSTLNIDFGYTSDNHLFRRHADFTRVRRRAAATITSVSVGSVPVPTTVPNNQTSTTFDLNADFSNHTFSASDLLGNFTDVAGGNIPDLPVSVTCTTCTTSGTIVITQGNIQVDTSQLDIFDGGNPADLITGGFFELQANGVGAHIELSVTPNVNGKATFGLPGFPILGFEIPGIGKAGVLFNHSIELDVTATGGLTLGYGFDVAVRVTLLPRPLPYPTKAFLFLVRSRSNHHTKLTPT